MSSEVKEPIKGVLGKISAINTANDAFTKALALKNECVKKNNILKGDKCVPVVLSATASMSKVTHRGWANDDGRDSGYVTNRYAEHANGYTARTCSMVVHVESEL